MPDGDQHAVDEQRMILREIYIAMRRAFVDGAPGHADGQHARMPATRRTAPEGLMADPLDRLRAGCRDDFSTDGKILDSDLAVRCENWRSTREAANAAGAITGSR